jgi:hypothetical protein
VQLISNRLVLFAGAGCWRSPTQPKLVKKIAANHNEKILDKDWLRRHGCALGRDSVRSTAGSVFEHARTSKPKFADGCSPDIANHPSPDIANTCNPDIVNACGYSSRKSA